MQTIYLLLWIYFDVNYIYLQIHHHHVDMLCRGAATDSGSPGQHIFELVTWHTTKYGDPYSEFVLCIWPILSAHTQQWTRTRSSGQPFMLRRPGSSWGFGALLKGTSVVVLKEERVLYIHSPHLQFLPARDSNSQSFDYESDSLTIRPRLPIVIFNRKMITLDFSATTIVLFQTHYYSSLRKAHIHSGPPAGGGGV